MNCEVGQLPRQLVGQLAGPGPAGHWATVAAGEKTAKWKLHIVSYKDSANPVKGRGTGGGPTHQPGRPNRYGNCWAAEQARAISTNSPNQLDYLGPGQSGQFSTAVVWGSCLRPA